MVRVLKGKNGTVPLSKSRLNILGMHGVRQIWVKNLAGGDPIQITFGQLAADRPRWSPRNDQIVFTLGSLGRDGASPEWRIESIWSVPPLGGAPRKIIESGGNPNWSGDGSRLVFERGREIWIVGADGSNPRKVEGVPAVGHLIADRMSNRRFKDNPSCFDPIRFGFQR